MEPLNEYEIQELLTSMGMGTYPFPIGSIWSNREASQMFLVLHHANLPTADGPTQCLVLQSLPTGEAWVQPTDIFANGDWQNVGFIWDRNLNV